MCTPGPRILERNSGALGVLARVLTGLPPVSSRMAANDIRGQRRYRDEALVQGFPTLLGLVLTGGTTGDGHRVQITERLCEMHGRALPGQ